jgi:hypothetical protein
MRAKRWVGFLIMLAVGIAAGLIYGWVINPPQPRNASLSSLRTDYQADYVLMVAETYQVDQDMGSALTRLEALDPDSAVNLVREAILSAQQYGFAYEDIQTMANLLNAMQSPLSSRGTP